MASFTLEPLQKSTIAHTIVQQIMERIQSGALQPGDRLPTERQLVEMLGVSRASVREALQALAAMGLIESRPGGGAFVKQVKPALALEMELQNISRSLQRSDRLHLMQARTIVERGLIELAIAHAGEPDLARLQTALQNWRQRCNLWVCPELDLHWPLHDRIHLIIAEMTGNPLLTRVLQMLLETLPGEVRARGLTPDDEIYDETALQEELTLHERLVEAIVARDTAAALHLFEQHQALEQRLIRLYYGE